MNKTKVFCLIFLGVILPLKAQLYTPSAIIQGASGNNNVGIGTAAPAAKLHINNAGTSGQLDYNLIVQKTEVADNNKSAVGLLLSTECCGAFGKSAIVHERTGGYGLGNLHFLNSNAFDTSIPTLLDAKMTINSNGNVGIGTTNPLAKLDVRGTSATTESTIQIVGTGVSSLLLGQNADGGVIRGQGSNNALSFWTGGSGDLAASGSGTEKMRINSNGNVGIGTTNPINKFESVGNESSLLEAAGFYNTSIYGNANDKAETRINLGKIEGSTRQSMGSIGAFPENNTDSSRGSLAFYTRESQTVNERLRIISNGNVGIGTTNPTSKLTVAGNINAREVKVTVDAGADFVFEKGYDLPSLASLDTYIKENKHLPEIASAQEMHANGINLSEMNIKLLQKMEEMTLYIIQQDKEIKAQAKEITAFKNVFERLSKIEEKLETKQ